MTHNDDEKNQTFEIKAEVTPTTVSVDKASRQ